MSQEQEKLIAELVNKGLDGDMDSVNACEDRIVRGKAKAMIMKVKKGAVERPKMPTQATETKEIDDQNDIEFEEVNDPFEEIKKMIEEKFPDDIDEG